MSETLYLMAQIITTVGYGDLVPVHFGGRMFTACYILLATLPIASVVSAVSDYSLSRSDAVARQFVQSLSFSTGAELPERTVREMMCPKWIHASALAPFVKASLVWSGFVLCGTLFFGMHPEEDKTFADAFYMSVVTLTTVGFGDLHPVSQIGKFFATIWMVLGVASFARMVTAFAPLVHPANRKMQKLDKYILQRMFESDPLLSLRQTDGVAKVGKSDFVLFMLCDLGMVDKASVYSLGENFDELDTTGDGTLTEEDCASIVVNSVPSISALASLT
eukprot:CAMPEP_0194521312 /NCGR_PEP_ID=MMETSP0253-20130528/55578_1 /TAXON_ID=2966 /ORGANISM="Noctiluca scintillans" /LENGTH=276 /DNA_ID=CAMNT_0039365659 /DNA_START=157 /DNA_END=987 /DNA_ORIENTATION=+